MSLPRFVSGSIAALLIAPLSTHAATLYWDISNANGLTVGAGIWSASGTDLYWATSTLPGTGTPTFWTEGSDADFRQGGSDIVTLNGTVNANSITTLNNTSSGTNVTINAGTNPLLIIGAGGITHTGNGLLAINAPVLLGANQTWNAGTAGGNGITVSGVISDNGSGFGITKTGTNTLTFNGSSAHTYSGATTINGGTFTVDFANAATPTNLINPASNLTLGGAVMNVRGKAASVASQTLGNLTLSANGGHNTINLVAIGTSTNLTLGDIWTRAAGSTLYLNAPTATTFTSDVSLTNGIIGGYATATVGGSIGFATISSGRVAIAGSTSLSASSDDSTANLSSNSAVTHNAGDWAANSLLLNGVGLDIGGGTLALTSGGVLSRGTTSGTDLISNGQLGGTNSEVIINQLQSRNLEISATISGGTGSLTKGGTGRTLIITGDNTYTGDTVVGAGTLQIGNGGTTGSIADSSNVIVRAATSLASGAVLAYNRSDASSVNNLTGGGNLLVNSGTLTLNQSGAGLNLGQVGGVSGSTLIFGGDGTGVTSLGNANSNNLNYMQVAGQNYKFVNGTINLLDGGRGFASNIEVAGATLNLTNNNFSLSGVAGGTQTFNFTSGQINVSSSFGVSGLNGNGGPSTIGINNSTFIGNQSGGTFLVNSANGRFDLGSLSNGDVSTYNLSGGIIDHSVGSGGFRLGADGAGTSVTTFNFSGGKILENVSIIGTQSAANITFDLTTNATSSATVSSTTGLVVGQAVTGTNIASGTYITAINTGTKVVTLSSAATGSGTNATSFLSSPKQSFVWTGGTLATLLYDANNLTSTSGTGVVAGVTNTLTNGGGTLAPGDIGTTGRTTINGNYNVTSSSAALHIDIAGTTSSSVFQNAPGTGFYDNVLAGNNNTTITLGGKLNVNLLDGFAGNGNFTIINNTRTGGLVTGTFNNTVEDALGNGQRVVLNNGLSSYLVTYNAQNVMLGSFQADNAWAGFDGANWSDASNWDSFSPQSAAQIAKFTASAADTGAHVINLDANRTIGGIIFDSAAHNYTLSSDSSSSLTLDNTNLNGPAASTVSVLQGSHHINVPVALNNNLTVTTSAGTALSVSGEISGSDRTLTKAGTGTLELSGDNTLDGGVVVSSGTLLVNNSTGSGTGTGALTIDASATLGGSGFINSATSIAGTLSPGNSPGILTFNGTVTLQAGSSTLIEISGSTSRGTDYDGINFNGGLTVEGGSLTFNISTAIADNATLNVFDSTGLSGGFASISATGTGGYNGTFSLTGLNSYSATFGSQTVTFDLSSGDLSFAGAAIPEPVTCAALLGMGSLALAGLRRRRTRHS